tara:strand:+ start:1681 stop:2127 length:447 start_codon:yes stop_codon:yes gene_type:complete
MKPYKNWSGKIRLQMYSKFKTLKKNNLLPEWLVLDGNCSMCNSNHKTMPHAEEYGETFEDYLKSIHVLCVRCHSMLHLRFSFSNKWVQYLDYIKQVREDKTDRLPQVAHMGVLFEQCRSWNKTGTNYKPNDSGEWWEKLSIERVECNE